MTINDVVNTELLSHPYNYVIVVLILALSAAALCLILSPMGQIGGIVQVA